MILAADRATGRRDRTRLTVHLRPAIFDFARLHLAARDEAPRLPSTQWPLRLRLPARCARISRLGSAPALDALVLLGRLVALDGLGAEVAAVAANAGTALGVVGLPLAGRDLGLRRGPEAVALEEGAHALRGRTRECVGQAAPPRLGQRVRHEGEADTLAQEARERVEAGDLAALPVRTRQQRADAGELVAERKGAEAGREQRVHLGGIARGEEALLHPAPQALVGR